MTNPTLPLTDQLPNGRELETAAHILHLWIGYGDISHARNDVLEDKPAALAVVAEARAQIAALDGDPRGWDAGVEAAVNVAPSFYSDDAIASAAYNANQMDGYNSGVLDYLENIRTLRTPPDPVPGLERLKASAPTHLQQECFRSIGKKYTRTGMAFPILGSAQSHSTAGRGMWMVDGVTAFPLAWPQGMAPDALPRSGAFAFP